MESQRLNYPVTSSLAVHIRKHNVAKLASEILEILPTHVARKVVDQETVIRTNRSTTASIGDEEELEKYPHDHHIKPPPSLSTQITNKNSKI
jgi:hypothetical protein